MENNKNITAKKIKLLVEGDKEEVSRVYKYLRDAIYNQNKAYNILISNVYSAMYSGKSTEEIKEIYKRGKRKPKKENPDWSLYDIDEINFPTGLSTASSLGQMVKADVQKAVRDGLLKGKISLPNRRLDAALRIESAEISFYHGYESWQEFLDHLYTDKVDVYMKFVNKITFRVVFGNRKKSHELRRTFERLLSGEYRHLGSTIEIDGRNIILNLSIEMPKKEIELDENVVAGVDLGMKIPAVCALNTNDYVRQSIGSSEDFLRVRGKIKAEKRRLQSSLQSANGGHGRKKKLKPLDKFSDYERNWARTYCHFISKKVVDFALQNKCKYINMENLQGFNANNYILGNWNYYRLQQDIIYKAERYGIIVRKVNSYHTSQRCSCCGYEDAGNRLTQANFKCLKCGAELNADFNAARNIAMSSEWSDGDIPIEYKIEQHRKHVVDK